MYKMELTSAINPKHASNIYFEKINKIRWRRLHNDIKIWQNRKWHGILWMTSIEITQFNLAGSQFSKSFFVPNTMDLHGSYRSFAKKSICLLRIRSMIDSGMKSKVNFTQLDTKSHCHNIRVRPEKFDDWGLSLKFKF